MKIYLASVVVVSMISSCFSASQLMCYQCSSATVGAENFCGEHFDQSNIPVDLMKERNISVERICNSTIDSEHERPVCRKTIEESVTGQIIVKRFCYYTNKSDPLDNCNSTSIVKNVRQLFCQDCEHDRCNEASHLKITVQHILFFFFCTLLTW